MKAKNNCKYCRKDNSVVKSLDYWQPLGWCAVFACLDCNFEWLDTEYHSSEEIALFNAKAKYRTIITA